MRYLVFSILLLSSIITVSQVPDDLCLTYEEQKLFNLVNQFRVNNDMEAIDLSRSLTYVAKLHVVDLAENQPDSSICNLHSWSDKGEWTACCHQAYVPKTDCMHDKPKELTPYRYRGYELVYKDSEIAVSDSVMMVWSGTEYAEEMILEDGYWSKKEWKAMGIGIYQQYACIWFGQRKDVTPVPTICGTADTAAIKVQAKESLLVKLKTGEYYLIAGSHNNLQDAEQAANSYINDGGLTNTKVLFSDNKYRIAIGRYPTLLEAKEGKNKLGKAYKDAWILKF